MKETSRIPIIRLHGNLIIPIQVAMSDRMVQLLKDDVTQKIEQERPGGVTPVLYCLSKMLYVSRLLVYELPQSFPCSGRS